MRPYEVMIILDAGLEDEANKAIVERANAILNGGGEVSRTDRWGKRRFAYELNHKWEGYYVLITATAEPATVSELDRFLSLADEVIRHKVIRLPDKVAARASAPAPVAVAETPAAEANEANGANE